MILRDVIDNWIITKGTKSFHWLYKKIEDDEMLLKELNAFCLPISIDMTLPQKIYHFYNKINQVPVCKYCHRPLSFVTFSRPYMEYCNRKCSQNNQIDHKEEINIKRTTTNMKKYGVPYVMQDENIKKRYSLNSEQKYGVNWVSQSRDVKDKISNTWQNKDDKEKIDQKRYDNYKKSIQIKYSDENLTTVRQLQQVQDKCRETTLQRYGHSMTFNVPEFIEKSKQTNMERYGYQNAMQNEDIQRKQFKSAMNFKKYVLPSGRVVNLQGYNIKAIETLLNKYPEEQIFIEFDCPRISYMFENKTHFYRPDFFINNENKYIEVKSLYYLFLDLDKNLAKIDVITANEDKLEYWLYDYNGNLFLFDFIETKISKLFKDHGVRMLYGQNHIFLIDYKIMINMININSKDNINLLQVKKDLMQRSNGVIRTINIFTDLIEQKYPIIKSRLLNLIGLSQRLYARHCVIAEIEPKVAKEFLNDTHIQGNSYALVNLGLYYQGELLSVMNFAQKRVALGQKHRIEGEYELLRFSSALNYTIVGGASKLLKYFIRNYKPKQIITYADKNWSDGVVYENMGFVRISETEPSYWYCKDGMRFHRFNFRKDRLVAMGHSKNLTEREIMNSLDYIRIYDCGNIKFEMVL